VYIHFARNRQGKLAGLFLYWRKLPSTQALQPPLPKEPEVWRVCEVCCVEEAVVYCRSHSRYLCAGCVVKHSGVTASPMDFECPKCHEEFWIDSNDPRCLYVSRAALEAYVVR